MAQMKPKARPSQKKKPSSTPARKVAGSVAKFAGNVATTMGKPLTGAMLNALGKAIAGNHPEWWGSDSNQITAVTALRTNQYPGSVASLSDDIYMVSAYLKSFVQQSSSDPFISDQYDGVIRAYHASLGLPYNPVTDVTPNYISSYLFAATYALRYAYSILRAQNGKNATDINGRSISEGLYASPATSYFPVTFSNDILSLTTSAPVATGVAGIGNAQWNNAVARLLQVCLLQPAMFQEAEYHFKHHFALSTNDGKDTLVTLYPMGSVYNDESSNDPLRRTTNLNIATLESLIGSLETFHATQPLLQGILNALGYHSEPGRMESFTRDIAGKTVNILEDQAFIDATDNLLFGYLDSSTSSGDIVFNNPGGVNYERFIKVPKPMSLATNAEQSMVLSIGEYYSLAKYQKTLFPIAIIVKTGTGWRQLRGYLPAVNFEWSGVPTGIPAANRTAEVALYVNRALGQSAYSVCTYRATIDAAANFIGMSSTVFGIRSADVFLVSDFDYYKQIARTNFTLGTNYLSDLAVKYQSLTEQGFRIK